MKFVNLHHHSTFSFGDGFGTPAQHVARAAALGYSAIALTEHGNVSSHFQLEKAALKAGIKPIFGLEGYCSPVDEETRGQFKFHLTILAADLRGYRNLNRIVTESFQNFYYHPTIAGSSIGGHSEGLIALSGCSGSLLACKLLGGKGISVPGNRHGTDFTAAEEVIWRFRGCFPEGHYYLEVQPFYEIDRTSLINPSYEILSKRTGVPLVVTCDVHYPEQSDSEMQAILHAVHRGKASVDDAMREWNYDVPLTLPESELALRERLERTGLSRRAATAAIDNTALIAGMCNVTLPKAEPLRYPIAKGDLEPWPSPVAASATYGSSVRGVSA
jgi:Zierdtviridae DNA polymerase